MQEARRLHESCSGSAGGPVVKEGSAGGGLTSGVGRCEACGGRRMKRRNTEAGRILPVPLSQARRGDQCMSMPAAERRRWTAAQVRQLIADSPEYGPRYELIAGELLVTPAPAPRHQVALLWLYDRIGLYVREKRLGYTMLAPADLELAPERRAPGDRDRVIGELYWRPDGGGRLRTWSCRSTNYGRRCQRTKSRSIKCGSFV